MSRLAAAAIAGMLIWFARSGLFVYFTGDDAMNLYFAWQKPYGRILFENIFYFTPGYRPMGTLIYRLLFDAAGMHALPYRIVCYLLIAGNVWLAYRVAAAIGGKEVGAMTALLGCYNSGFADLYLNTGTIYDLLSFTFYFLALGLYVGDRNLRGWRLAGFLALYVCALNSKEAAASLPAVLMGYELILRRGERTRWLPIILSGLLTVPFVIGKFSAASPLVGNEGYRLHLGVRTYFRALTHYLGIFAGPAVAFLAIPMLVAARRPRVMFALFFVLAALLPVAFITLRGGYAAYIASFGIALAVGSMMVEWRSWSGTGARIGTFVLCFLALLWFHSSRPLPEINLEDRLIRSLVSQLEATQLKLEPKGRVLLIDDPFPLSYTPLFVLRLYYRAPELEVDRPKMMSEKPERKGYECVLSFDGARLEREDRAWATDEDAIL